MTVTDEGGCSYAIPDDGEVATKFLVSKSGLAVARDTYTSGTFAGKTDTSVIVPAQTIPLAELAGSWNALQYARDDTTQPLTPSRLVLALNANGQITSGMECDSASNCETFGAAGTFSVNANGRFNLTEGDSTSRAFAFKTADGSLSLFILDPNNLGMVVATKQQTLALPAVGTVSKYWDFSLASTGFASGLVSDSTTVSAIDAAGSCTLNGAANHCSGLVTMPLFGTGVAVYISASPNNFFAIAVNQP
jgi:hypothetical protein